MKHLLKVQMLILGLVLCLPALGWSAIVVEPGTTVRVGEEVFFDGSGGVYEPSFEFTRFEWDFGDSYKMVWPISGLSTVHIYTNPGAYNVVLTMSDRDGGFISEFTEQIIVEGPAPNVGIITTRSPLLNLRFNGNLADEGGNNTTVVSVGGTEQYVNGASGEAVNLNGSYVSVTNAGVLNNLNELTFSIWVKKNNPEDKGVIFDNGGIILEYVGKDFPGRVLLFGVRTEQGLIYARENWVVEGYNTEWNHYVGVYDGSQIRLYINGKEMRGVGSQTGRINADADLHIGIDSSEDQGRLFNGSIDELVIYDKAFPPEGFTTGFEVYHADFHGRIAQYLYAQIPQQIINEGGARLVMQLISDTGYSLTICDRLALNVEEKVLLRNSELPPGSYSFIAQLLNQEGGVICEQREYFEKQYTGVPKVGIDENNAIRVNGELFFLVTPWGLNDEFLAEWAGTYINSLYVKGFWLRDGFGDDITVQSWNYYLSKAQEYNLTAIGPGGWEGHGSIHYERNSNLFNLQEYVTSSRDNPAMLMWMWDDEPNLGGPTEEVPPEVLRSWTYLTHSLDPQHLVATNFAGKAWTTEAGAAGNYTYLYNKKRFGRKTHLTDVYGFDYYPIDWARIYDARIEKLAYALDAMHEETYNLIPIMSFVETGNIRDDVRRQYGNRYYSDPDPMYNTPAPTPEQLNMLTWLNVVHGVKGINWFPFFGGGTTEENYAVMAQFLKDITELTPVVLGPEVDMNVTDNSNEIGNRVDTMIREHEGNVYLFAVRLTEINDTGRPDEHDDITTTFSISGTASGSAEVFNENRTISVSGGSFTDTFAPNAVHIYKITGYEPEPPKPEPDPEPEVIDPHAVPDAWDIKCINNIFKTSQSSPVKIQVDVKEQSYVSVILYDSKGKKIKTIYNEEKSPGSYIYEWFGDDDSGKKVGSGIYMVHMEAGGYKETKKIAVIK